MGVAVRSTLFGTHRLQANFVDSPQRAHIWVGRSRTCGLFEFVFLIDRKSKPLFRVTGDRLNTGYFELREYWSHASL